MEVRRYLTASRRDVFGEWLSELRDIRTKAKIVAGIDRLSAEISATAKRFAAVSLNCASTGDRAIEFITHWWTRRVFCCSAAEIKDKRKQSSDIKRALEYVKDYRERTP